MRNLPLPDGADWTYVLPDALGSVRQEADATGAVTAAREWSPYGVAVGGAQAGLGYTGEWFDVGVGLVYLRARWYRSQEGRLTQKDLWMGNQSNPFTQHPYIYALANPVSFIDPSGLIAECSGFPPKCFIVYLTGVGEELHEAGQREFLSRISGVAVNHLGDPDSPVILIGDPIPYASNKPAAIQQVALAAYSTSASEIALAQTIDSELTGKDVKPYDEVNIIAWSGGAQLGVGAAAQMRHYVDHTVLLGGAFRADEGLANIGLTYDLFGDQEPRYRKPEGGPDNWTLGTMTYAWDLFNHGWRSQPRLIPGGGPFGEPEMGTELVHYAALDLYRNGKIIHIPVPGSDHFGYFDAGKADVIIQSQTRVCKKFFHLPLVLRD